ncbi:MAG TPA: anti-sigma factor [Stellaceae bacterium]|nr:anti-sigma factor [Stellaceae bacterium]
MSDLVPGCEKVLLVQAELDGELDAAQAAALEAHRTDCPICRAAQAELMRARGLMRGDLYEPMPDDVRTRVMARLRQVAPPPAPAPRRRRNWDWLRGPSIGFGLGAACAAAISLLVVLPERNDLIDQVVADHIRALQPGHLEDVVSTDQHTVKPWFDGRIDFAPPVRDFAAEGFPLRGGRLDYLGGRPVAALVYQRDKHIIDLYVWPASGAGPHLAGDTTIQGYNVVHWAAGGMNFWAVSDVERSQLDDFAALWKKAP